MRILFFSDLHAHNFTQFSTRLENGMNSRLQDCLGIIDQIITLVSEKELDAVYFLGDIFHSRTKIDVDVFSSVYDSLSMLGHATSLHMLVGNHDQHTRVGDIHSVDIFREFAEVIDSPTIIRRNGIKIAAHPHTSYVPHMQEWIRNLGSMDIFLFHQGLREATVGPYDMHVKTELSVDDLPLDRARFCIGGDFHKRQFIRENLHYVGSPLQLSFGERGERKFFTIIDSKDWSLEEVETSAPKFFLHNLDSFEQALMDQEELRSHFVRMLVPKSDYEKAIAWKNVFPKLQVQLEEEEIETVQRVGNEVVGNDHLLLQSYIENSGTELDEQELFDLGMSVLLGGYDA